MSLKLCVCVCVTQFKAAPIDLVGEMTHILQPIHMLTAQHHQMGPWLGSTGPRLKPTHTRLKPTHTPLTNTPHFTSAPSGCDSECGVSALKLLLPLYPKQISQLLPFGD